MGSHDISTSCGGRDEESSSRISVLMLSPYIWKNRQGKLTTNTCHDEAVKIQGKWSDGPMQTRRGRCNAYQCRTGLYPVVSCVPVCRHEGSLFNVSFVNLRSVRIAIP